MSFFVAKGRMEEAEGGCESAEHKRELDLKRWWAATA